jgi:hypothetical protein
MSALPACDGISWYPVSAIEKYSADQVRYAREHREVPGLKRLPPREVLHGDLMRLLFREPEDGTVRDEGNGVTVAGTVNLAMLLSGAGGYPLTEGRAVFGVAGTTARTTASTCT